MASEFRSNLIECLQAADLLDRIEGGPWPGVHAGDGRHCDMPGTWDGNGEIPEGWCSARQQIRMALDGVNRAIVGDRLAAYAQRPAVRARLTAAQLAKLDDFVARLQEQQT